MKTPEAVFETKHGYVGHTGVDSDYYALLTCTVCSAPIDRCEYGYTSYEGRVGEVVFSKSDETWTKNEPCGHSGYDFQIIPRGTPEEDEAIYWVDFH